MQVENELTKIKLDYKDEVNLTKMITQRGDMMLWKGRVAQHEELKYERQ